MASLNLKSTSTLPLRFPLRGSSAGTKWAWDTSDSPMALSVSRECLTFRVGVSFKGEDVAAALTEIIKQGGAPRSIRVDNGTEFTSVVIDCWAYFNGVTLTSTGQASRRIIRLLRRSTTGSGRNA